VESITSAFTKSLKTRATLRSLPIPGDPDYLLPMLVGARRRPSESEIRQDFEEVVTGFLSTLRPKPRGKR
jgi:hypothetical protein